MNLHLYIMMPTINIGMNKRHMNNMPLDQFKVPAGKNSNNPINTTPEMYFITASKSRFFHHFHYNIVDLCKKSHIYFKSAIIFI